MVFRPVPPKGVAHRALIPFHKKLTIRLNGSIYLEDARVIYRSPILATHGYTRAEVFATINVLADDGHPLNAIAFLGAISQACGSGGAVGPVESVGFGVPGVGKGHFGTGLYTLFVVNGGTSKIEDGLTTSAVFELRALGKPQDRELTIVIEGAIIAGKTYRRRTR